ncbi:LysR family transcriptional regulator [Robiginitomaculum antarcticum]|uniref:LysR family transcriptional regulator n=1 Tax=Robiginitomaculum antarcticum TaxID=437507 RepID=UPI000365DDFD|nr:LysR family transcriptional regulator [Robiginitomaculum antarcticum]
MSVWSDYPIFLAIAESGSLTAAGAKLGISQPTAGRRLRALEESLGGALVRKSGGALVPTEFGADVLKHVNRMNDEAAAISRRSVTHEDNLSGPVRISASQGLGDFWLPIAMREFSLKYPDILIDINVDFRAVNLAQREADIALRWLSPGTQNSVIGRKVVSFGFGFYAAKEYIARRGMPKSFADLSSHDGCRVMTDGEEIMWKYSTFDGDTSPMRPVIQSDSIGAHITAIASGYGIGVLAHGAISEVPGLVPVLPDYSHSADLWVVAHEDLRKSKRMRACFDYLVEALRRDEAHFATGSPSVFPEHGYSHVNSLHAVPSAAE